MAPLRSVPVIVTDVPPVTGPEFGLTEVTTGVATETMNDRGTEGAALKVLSPA